jgi:hypothetical protein
LTRRAQRQDHPRAQVQAQARALPHALQHALPLPRALAATR